MPDDAKMLAYIGTKIVGAVPMTELAFAGKERRHHVPLPAGVEARDPRDGYRVVYPDGYESWSPKDVFEAAYRLVSDDERRMM